MHMDMKIQLVKEILEEHFSYVKITGLCATSPGFCCDYGRKDNALKLIKMVSCFNAESAPSSKVLGTLKLLHFSPPHLV